MKRIPEILMVLIATTLLAGLAVGCSSSSSIGGDYDLSSETDLDGDMEDTEEPEGDTDGDADEDGDVEEETAIPTVSFDDGDSWSVTYADDANGSLDGVQISVGISTENIDAGVAVSLTVGDSTEPLSGTLGDDGKATFADVTLEPGTNNLGVTVDLEGDDDLTAAAAVTLTGCRIIFVDPIEAQSLTDAGGTCSADDCGDDLDCNMPNLQYNVSLTVENVGVGRAAALTVGDVDPLTANVAADGLTFSMVSLPHNASLPLSVEVTNAAGFTCEAEINVAVDIQCDCHLVIDPIPEDYNLAVTDDDDQTDGFQKRFTATSDNCLDGSQVSFTVDAGTRADPVVVTLENQQAVALLTLPDGSHTLEMGITEPDTARTGAAGPYSFRVDREAPLFDSVNPTDGMTLSKLNDSDLDLSNGIQIAVSGVTTGVEALDPALTVALTIDDVDWPETADVANNQFNFASVTLSRPDGAADPVAMVLELTVQDELGNPTTETINLNVYFDEPELTLTEVGTKPVADPLILNIGDDEDGVANLLQVTVTASSNLIPENSNARLFVDSGAPVDGTIGSDGSVTWEIALDNGAHTLSADAELSGVAGAVEAEDVDLWADWEAPMIQFVSPQNNDYVDTNVMDVTVYSDAENASDGDKGQKVTLLVNGSALASGPVALDADGLALFEDVDVSMSRLSTFQLEAEISDYAGNDADTQLSLNVDNQAPTVAVTATPDVGNPAQVEILITVSDDAPTEGRDVTLTLFNVNSAPVQQDQRTLSLASGEATYTYNSLPDSSYSVTARYEDQAGNDDSSSDDFEVDTGCYTMSITAPTNGVFYGIADAVGGNPANGVDISVVVEAGGVRPIPDASAVFLQVDGALPGISGTMASGVATFANVNLDAGSHTLEVYTLKQPGPVFCYASPRPVNVTVDFTAPTLSLTSPAPPVPATDPLVYNLASTDVSPDAGFQAAFTYRSLDAGEGQDVTLVVSDGSRAQQSYTAALNASGDALFNSVTLSGSTFAQGTLLTLTATVEDESGNTSDPVAYFAIVDRLAPTFSNIMPTAGSTLNSGDDNDPVAENFQLLMTLTIADGTPGSGNVSVEVVPSADPGNPYDLGPFNLQANGSVTITGSFTEGSYTLNIAHTDEAGNSGDTSVFYQIDFVAELTLLDKNFDPIPPDGGGDTVLDSSFDTSGDAGFQTNFYANTRGFQQGLPVYLCSTLASEGTNGVCTSAPGGVTAYRVASALVTAGSGDAGSATFSDIDLDDQATRLLFVEGTDGANNYSSSEPATVIVDATAPTVDAFVITDNLVGNDFPPNIVLNRNEGDIVTGLLVVDMRVDSADSDAETVRVYVGAVDGTIEASASLSAGSAVLRLPDVSGLPNGYTDELNAVVVDENGNESDPFTLPVIVDLRSPSIAFVGSGLLSVNADDCSGFSGDACETSVSVTVTRAANDLFDLDGGVVTITDSASRAVVGTAVIPSIAAGASAEIPVDVTLDEGSYTLYASAADPYGNLSETVNRSVSVDVFAPTVAFVTPSSASITYDGGTDDQATCGGSTTDQYFTRCDWQVSASGVTSNTTLQLYYKVSTDPGDFNPFDLPSQGSTSVSADGNWSISRADFQLDGSETFLVKVQATEVATGNVGWSDEVSVTINGFSPTWTIAFKRLDDSTFASGAIFDENDEKDGDLTNASVTIDFKVSTNIPDGETMSLSVNGNGPASQSIASGIATFSDVVLNEGAQNTLSVEVVGYTSSSVTVIADTKNPELVFTSPVFKATYNVADDTDTGDRTGVLLGSSVVVKTTDIMPQSGQPGYTVRLVADDGTKAVTTLATANWTTDTGVYKYKATFTNVSLPNGAISLDVKADDTGAAPVDRAEHQGAVQTPLPSMTVDADPPADATSLEVCLGSDTGTTGSFDQDGVNCTSAYACNSLSSRCDRHAGTAALVWTAPSGDGTTGSVTPSSYEIHYVKKTGTVDPCSGVTWATANSPSAGVTVTVDALVAPSSKQGAVVTGLSVNTDTSYCFLVKAKDAAGNSSINAVSVAREVAFIKETLVSGVGGSELVYPGYYVEFGDFNGDGCADVAVADPYWGTQSTCAEVDKSDCTQEGGKVSVIYGDDGDACTPESDWETNGFYQSANSFGDNLGWSLGVGDLNGDCIDDLAVSASRYNSDDGGVFVYLGSSSGLKTTAGDVAGGEPSIEPDVTIGSDAGGYQGLGNHIEVMNWNGDTVNCGGTDRPVHDLFVSTYFYSDYATIFFPVYAFLGGSGFTSGANFNVTSGDEDFSVQGLYDDPTTTYSWYFGFFLSHGDLDGDGYEDLLISDTDYQWSGGTRDHFWVVWGNSTVSSSIQAPAAGFLELPPDTADQVEDYGFYVGGVLDTDNDGLDEALVRKLATNSVHYWKSTTGSERDVADTTRFFQYETSPGSTDTYYGIEPATAGDFNHSGFNDVILSGTGIVRVFWGRTGGIKNDSEAPGAPEDDFININGLSTVNTLQAKGNGDFDNDGSADIVVVDQSTGDVYLIH